MGQFDYLKLLWGILYLVFAGISCWATAESLNLTWPSIPIVVCYGIAIGFYLVASIGATMVANAFNRNKFISNRNLMLSGGIAILLFFWLITSLPTNTHTFLYRNKISDVLNEEQQTTNGYLKQIQTGQAIKNRIVTDTIKLANNVKAQCTALENEIKNELNPGFGPKSKEIKKSIENLLGIVKLEELNVNVKDNSEKARDILAKAYRRIIYAHLAEKEKSIENLYLAQYKLKDQYNSQAKSFEKNINTWINAWQRGDVNVNDADDIKKDFNDKRLMPAYSLINTCKLYVEFANKEHEERFTSKNLTSNISNIISVYDLWYEFLFGAYKGSMFMIFCILISLLVDIAAFVFFYLIQKD